MLAISEVGRFIPIGRRFRGKLVSATPTAYKLRGIIMDVLFHVEIYFGSLQISIEWVSTLVMFAKVEVDLKELQFKRLCRRAVKGW